ncbi:glycosyltransferase family 2 protein [Fredinandcohnia humi]
MTAPVLTIVIPCYNEEEVLPETMRQLTSLLDELTGECLISEKSKLLFVDDGSKDMTWPLIYKKGLEDYRVKGIKLARNAGHQNALLAGLFAAKAHSDCLVSIDADLQDDISVIREFLARFADGYEVVYGVRRERQTDTLFKKHSAQVFYKVMKLMGVTIVYNHADYRLMSRRAVDALEQFNESNLFLRGVVPLVGFRSTTVYYDRKERLAGETKYPLRKMLSFALDGITSFSVTPIRLISLMGFISFFVSLLFGGYFFFLKFSGQTETGWTSLITSIWLIGGLQLIAMGFIGEYIGKIYKETKRRPKFVVDIDTYNLGIPKTSSKNGTNQHLNKEGTL